MYAYGQCRRGERIWVYALDAWRAHMIGRVLSTYEYMHMDNGRVVSAYDWARGERARGHGWHRIPGCEFGRTGESV